MGLVLEDRVTRLLLPAGLMVMVECGLEWSVEGFDVERSAVLNCSSAGNNEKGQSDLRNETWGRLNTFAHSNMVRKWEETGRTNSSRLKLSNAFTYPGCCDSSKADGV
jgi:hypothetical protein